MKLTRVFSLSLVLSIISVGAKGHQYWICYFHENGDGFFAAVTTAAVTVADAAATIAASS